MTESLHERMVSNFNYFWIDPIKYSDSLDMKFYQKQSIDYVISTKFKIPPFNSVFPNVLNENIDFSIVDEINGLYANNRISPVWHLPPGPNSTALEDYLVSKKLD